MTDAPSPAEHPAPAAAAPTPVSGPAAGPVDRPADDGVTLTPVETDTGRIVAVGTALFAVAAVLLLVLRFTAPDWSQDRSAWVWIALAGTLLGATGWVIVGRHRRLGRTR